MISQQYRSLQQATSSLDQALRAPNVRGKWGEVQLRRLVELAGMSEHVDFSEQTGRAAGSGGSGGGTAAGQGATGEGRGRPDLIVRLPSQGIMPVDAKAPMNAYLESHEAASPDLARQALKRHAAALRGHIQSLSSKAYWKQFDRAPDFVVLLVPYESGLSAAFGVDPDLLEYALANKVVVTAPASFLALLRVVAYGWMQVRLSENAEAISQAGRELLERLGPFAEHLNKVGAGLNQAADRFNDAAGSFERRILPTARKLYELGAAAEPPPEIGPVETHSRRIQHDE
ncbi:MAG: DNA recombination protein RmuC [Alkalispirochaeta sp.]